MQANQAELTINTVIESYQALTSPNLDIKRRANNFLIQLLHQDQALNISRQLIVNQNDPKYQVLGSQILYQKVAQDLQDMSIQLKTQLRNFIFSILENQSVVIVALIDKLVSALALIVCTMLSKEWQNFMSDLLEFMKRNPNCLKNGLFLLERIPEELRITNRIQIGLKQHIIEEFFKYEKQMAGIFQEVLYLGAENIPPAIHKQLIKRNLNAMESWSKSRFNFLKYTDIIRKTLIQSLQDFQKFQNAIVVIVETIKSASINKEQNLNSSGFHKELELYSQDQVNSIKIILQYIEENSANFMNFNNWELESEHRESFLDIVKQLVLNFGFLILQEVGFKLLQIIMHFTNSLDFKTSYQTFQFWVDMSEKIANQKTIPQPILNQFTGYMVKLFEIINSKTIVQHDEMLDDPQLKQDLTFDDPTVMNYSQYRKQSIFLYQYIYNYFLKITKSPNSFFEACFNYIRKDVEVQMVNYTGQKCYQFHKNTELALFCIKSSQQSMVSEVDAENIRKILNYLLSKIVTNQVRARARVIAQILLLISECTRQIKCDTNLLYECLKFSMKYITDQTLCFYSSRAFKNIIEAMDTINDSTLVYSLIEYYVSKEFSRELIIGEILEGIFGTIQKFQNRMMIPEMMGKLIQNIYDKFKKAELYLQENQLSAFNNSLPFYVPLLEIKTILSSFLSTTQIQFKNYFLPQFQNLSNSGLQMIGNIMPYCLKTAGQKLILYNELGFSCSIYKSALKICNIEKINIHAVIKVLEESLSDAVLSANAIVEMCGMLGLLSDTLIAFTGQNSIGPEGQANLKVFDQWLLNKFKFINSFFFVILNRIEHVDTDVIKWFFTIQQSLILYNQQLFLSTGHLGQILDIGIYCVRHINEQKMQRKVINVLYLCCHLHSQQLQIRKQKILSQTFRSIPIVNSISYHNLSKIFMFLFPQLTEQKCAEFIYLLLKGNPYTDISQKTLTLIAQSFFFCLKINNERYLMMICKEMQSIVVNGEKKDTPIQLELSLKSWQREHKKKTNN